MLTAAESGQQRKSDQARAAVHHQDVTGAIALLHKIKVGLGDLCRISNVAYRQPF
jgi:hypothetical protein